MDICAYSLKKDGGQKVAPHFSVAEFACRDGSDKILLSTALVNVLEDIRMRCGGKPVRVNSGYRNEAYNKKISGASNSQHTKGTAADISMAGVLPRTLCESAETALLLAGIPGGVGLYDSFAHVDVRQIRSRWEQTVNTGGKQTASAGFAASVMPTLREGSRGDAVTILQAALNRFGAVLGTDGTFGTLTTKTVRAFQGKKGLVQDGVVGPNTWKALML